MPANLAAWIEGPAARPLVIRDAPYKSPGRGQVLIKNAAVAMNPVDFKLQAAPIYKLTYPAILGFDVAGEVAEVGQDVTHVKPGSKVFALTYGAPSQEATQGGFQNYTLAPANLTSIFPDSMPVSTAVVISTGVATAAAALYQKEFLALDLPSSTTQASGEKGVVVVWGGSSSVGSSAIQLLANSGYEAFTVVSKRNFDFVKDLGAAQAFDYNSANVVQDIISALKGKRVVMGYFDAISLEDTVTKMVQIAGSIDGKKFVATVLDDTEKYSSADVTVKHVYSTAIANNEVGPAIFHDFLPQALAEGKFLAKPDPVVVGHGLGKVQEAMDSLSMGVSAAKLVVTL